jgi:hypothetical protein
MDGLKAVPFNPHESAIIVVRLKTVPQRIVKRMPVVSAGL